MSKIPLGWKDCRPTRNDVAKLAQISGTTVSRVLGGKTDQSVSPAARARVLQAARELGYVPNSAAQALRSGFTGLIGFWMCLEYSRYRSQVLDQMRAVLKSTDLALAVSDVDDEYISHSSLVRALRLPTDGIIAFDASVSAEAFVHSGDKSTANMPFVSMGASWSESRSYVGIDLKAGAEEAMDHLFATGRKRVAYLVPRDPSFVAQGARYQGYLEKILEAGFEPHTLLIDDVPSIRIASIVKTLVESRAAGFVPDALLCFYDDIAIDAVPAIMEIGLSPGRDIAIVGFNGNEGADRGPCPISTVRQPTEKMCALAYQFLKTQIDDASSPIQKETLKPELIIRESSRWPR